MIDALRPGLVADPARSAAARSHDDPQRVRKAAEDFEALLVAQLLKSVRESGSGGWLGSGEDSASASAMEIAEEQFGRLVAAGGGLGLAKLVVAGLERKS